MQSEESIYRLIVRSIGALLVVLMIAVLPTPEASGFPGPRNNSNCNRIMTYYMHNDQWMSYFLLPGEWSAVQGAMEDYNADGWDGLPETNVNTWADHIAIMTVVNNPSVSWRGQVHFAPGDSPCGSIFNGVYLWDRFVLNGATIEPGPNNAAGNFPIHWRNIAHHEFGHVLGLEHTGIADAHGNTPAMSTCTDYTARFFGKDDVAAANYHADGYGPLFANPGFERGDGAYWILAGGSYVTAADASHGDYSVVVPPSGSVRQKISYYHEDETRNVHMNFWTRTAGGSNWMVGYFGTARASYNDINDPSCSYVNGAQRHFWRDAQENLVTHFGIWGGAPTQWTSSNYASYATSTLGTVGGKSVDVLDLEVSVYNWGQQDAKVDTTLLYDSDCITGDCQ